MAAQISQFNKRIQRKMIKSFSEHIGGNTRMTEPGAGDRSWSAGGRAWRLQTAAVLV